MDSGRDIPDAPQRVGVDDWVAEHGERRVQYTGLQGLIRRWIGYVPSPARLALFAAFAATLPFWMNRGDLFVYGIITLLYLVLGLGLNVVVGYAGLLDLGYIAFFGFGAYLYALLSSGQFDVHWPATATIPIVMVSTALLGLVLGIPSRRLLGDYLAIVTPVSMGTFAPSPNVSN